MRVFVTGATGAIGPHAVRALVDAGHEVSALARTSEKAEIVRSLGAEPVTVSLFDRDALAKAFAGHDAVVNLATAIPPTAKYALPWAWKENARIRTEGTAAVVDAAIAAGVLTLVQESIIYVYADGGSNLLTEESPIETFPIVDTTPTSEAHIARFTESGGTGVVLRFGLFYGTGSQQSKELMFGARMHFGVVLGAPKRYFSPINVEDGGRAAVAALRAPAGIYNIVDDVPITKKDFGKAISTAVGKKALVSGPGRLMALTGKNSGAITRSHRVSNAKFKSVTDWEPKYPSAFEGWEQTAIESGGKPSPALLLAAIAVLIVVLAVVVGVMVL